MNELAHPTMEYYTATKAKVGGIWMIPRKECILNYTLYNDVPFYHLYKKSNGVTDLGLGVLLGYYQERGQLWSFVLGAGFK